MPSSNPVWVNVVLHDDHGSPDGTDFSIGSSSSKIQAISKILVDDVFDTGSVDLAPVLESIKTTGPVVCVVDIDNATGAQINIDGKGKSKLCYKKLVFQIVPNGTDPLDIELTLADPARIRVLCYGDVAVP